MERYQELGKQLRRYINPATFPVAIRFLADQKALPPDAHALGANAQQ